MTDERQVRTVRSVRPGDLPVHPIVLDALTDRPGMSKREHYASLILAGLYANPAFPDNDDNPDFVSMAVSEADRLVAKLSEADRGDA